MKKSVLPLVAALLVAAPAAAEQPAPVENDLRCIAVFSAMAGSVPEAQRGQIATAVMYFVGHAGGLAPAMDLKAELKRVVTTLSADAISGEVKRCGDILTAKGAQLQELGKELSGAQ